MTYGSPIPNMKATNENLPPPDPNLCRWNKIIKEKKKIRKKTLGRNHKTLHPMDGMPNYVLCIHTCT